MAIPDLDQDGLLPPGVHSCSEDEVRARFGNFQRSDCRILLCGKLLEFFKELRSTGLARAVIVDGSFVTSIDEPHDIDLVLVLPVDHDVAGTLRPFEYNVLSRRMVRKMYGFDMFAARERSGELQEYVDFFQQVRGRDERRKGVLEVRL